MSGIILDRNPKQSHNIKHTVLFEPIDTKNCINTGAELINLNIFIKGHQTNIVAIINW